MLINLILFDHVNEGKIWKLSKNYCPSTSDIRTANVSSMQKGARPNLDGKMEVSSGQKYETMYNDAYENPHIREG